jgi:dihydrofolate reductase
MRKLIYSINLSIDGCVDHTKMLPPPEMLDYFTELTRNAGALLYGRITYQLMVPYWPDVAKDPSARKSSRDFADAFNSVGKVVFSRSLDKVEDENSRLVRTDLVDEILKLKQEPGNDMLVGGVDLPSQLIALGLVDEFLFVFHPVIAGDGRRLMEGIVLQQGLLLKLIESKVLGSGHVALRYGKQ